jgi:cardiolipin synthase
MNLPNSITIARLASVPFISWLIVREAYGWALVAFAVAAASDAVDGLLARLLDQRTALGAMLDPAADKLLVVAALFTLGWVGLAPAWLVWTIFGRDLVLSAGYWGAFAAGRRLPVRPTLLGKLATVLLLAVVIWILVAASRPGDGARAAAPTWLYVLAAGVALASGLDYLRTGYALLRDKGKRA